MLRKTLLAGIMIVSVAIIMVALQRQRPDVEGPVDEGDASSAKPVPDEKAKAKDEPIRLEKYNDQHDLVAVITGEQAEQKVEKGPIFIVKPTIRILRDPDRITVITSDTGYLEGTDKKRMGEGWLRGDVVMTVHDAVNDDNTVLTCEELQYHGEDGQVTIPGDVHVRNRSMAITGRQLIADRLIARAELHQNVRVLLKEGSDSLMREMSGERETTRTDEEAKKAPPAPVIITCDDKLVFSRDDNRASFSKNVVARQEQTRATGDAMVITFEKVPVAAEGQPGVKTSRTSVRRVIMTAEQKEGVVVTGEEMEARGDRLEYDAREGLLIFAGAPCYAVQNSPESIFKVDGNEIRFGRRRLLAEGEPLPEGMTADSRKVLVTGAPARAVQIPREGGESSLLSGQRVLFDQDAQIVWLQGDDKVPARAERNRDHMTAMRIELFRKTPERGQHVTAEGPGRLELLGRAETPEAASGQPTTVDFSKSMLYLTDRQQAEFVGDVKLVDQTTSSRSQRLLIEFDQTEDPETKRTRTQIRRITAEGDVEVVDANRTAIGEKLVYSFPEPGRFIAEVTAKPGGVGQIQWSDHLMRSSVILITQTPVEGGEKITRVEGKGKGYLLYRPMAETVDEAERQSGTIEIWYDDRGLYDEGANRALFDGNVRVKKDLLHVASAHAKVDFAKGAKVADTPAGATRLAVTTLTASDDVTVRIGDGDDETTAKGARLIWRRQDDVAELHGSEDGKSPASVVREKNTIEAPLILALMSRGQLYEIIAPRGGHMIGFSSAQQDGAEVLKKLDVTWNDTGSWRPTGSPEVTTGAPPDPQTGYARVTGDAVARSEDSEITSGVMTVRLRRQAPDAADALGEEKKASQRLSVTQLVATHEVRLRQFLSEEGNYRFGKADRLEWDREVDRMMLESATGDALVWDNSNQWTGEKLVLSRRSDGRYEVESTGGQPLILYEDSKPEKPVKTPEPRKWEPIY